MVTNIHVAVCGKSDIKLPLALRPSYRLHFLLDHNLVFDTFVEFHIGHLGSMMGLITKLKTILTQKHQLLGLSLLSIEYADVIKDHNES